MMRRVMAAANPILGRPVGVAVLINCRAQPVTLGKSASFLPALLTRKSSRPGVAYRRRFEQPDGPVSGARRARLGPDRDAPAGPAVKARASAVAIAAFADGSAHPATACGTDRWRRTGWARQSATSARMAGA